MRTNPHHFFASLGVLAFSTSVQAAVISNAGFEADTFTTFPGYSSQPGNGPITGWTASVSGNIGLNPSPSSPFANNGVVPEGSNVAFIQSNNNTRTLTSTAGITGLTPGNTYNVTYRANSRAGYATPNMALVVNGVTALQNQQVTSVGGANPYEYVSVNFTATSATASLAVSSSTSTGDGALVLDNFTVTAATPKFTTTAWNGDASSGISLAGVAGYTHAYNLGGGAADVTVNGVDFTAVTSGNPSVVGSFSFNMPASIGFDPNNVTGNSTTLANSFLYNNQNATLTLEGLTAGELYRTSIYTVGWDNSPGRNSTFEANGERLTVDASGLGNNNGTRVDYEFIATGATQDININSLGSNTFHTYAFANVAIPEPSSIMLLSLAGLGLLGRRRR